MKQFITIKEAGALTGKADITIRRLIKRLLTQDKPEINQMISQMISQKKTPSGYQYKINSEFLLKELKMDHLLDKQKSNQVSKQKSMQSKKLLLRLDLKIWFLKKMVAETKKAP